MLIDRTYFIGELNIPNTEKATVASQVDYFIEKYEREFLQKALGYSLYKSFTDGLLQDPVLPKWTQLLEGVEYTSLNGRVNYWNGLVSQPLSVINKKSPIAGYVYYWFMRNNFTQTAAMGEVKGTAENAINVSPGMKMEKAWNDVVKSVHAMRDFLRSNHDTYNWDDSIYYPYRDFFAPVNTMNI
jgi:hypothetical protein